MNIRSLTDKIFSFFALIFFSPVLFFVALLILCTSNGPIFFRQERIGKHGKPFIMLKFRTMINENNKHLDAVVNRELVTSIGRFLRKWKIDELPEFWNVLKGDMSIVGPRPYISGFTDKLEGEEKKILNLKPGLTSIASLKYIDEEGILSQQEIPPKYYRNIIYPDKIKLDIRYYECHSFLLDTKIIWYTIFKTGREKFLDKFE
ncbi:MAG: sugar transferase [Bacteroidales bacterium]|nr:sugar transferase [Bacteroidales bacterium]